MPGNYSDFALNDVFLFGKFDSIFTNSGGSQPNQVTIQVCMLPGNILVPLSTDVCTESQIPGYWFWQATNINPSFTIPGYPSPVTMLYVMRDLYNCEYSGKFVLNQLAEEARRAYLTAQALL